MQEGPLLGGPSNTNSLLSVVAVAAIGRIVADVHPTIIGYPLDTRFVAVSVTTVVRQRGGQCDASAYIGPATDGLAIGTADLLRFFANRIQAGEEIQSVVGDMRQQEKRIAAVCPD